MEVIMEATQILNTTECGYNYFVTVGKTIIGCGLKGGVKKLDILRVVIIQDNSVKPNTIWSKLGLSKANIAYDVDADIYTADGNRIEIHSSEEKFLRKLMPYVWELKKKNPRVEFYGTYQNRPAIDATRTIFTDTDQLRILEQQLQIEQQCYDQLMTKVAEAFLAEINPSLKTLNLQKRALNSQKRILKLSRQIADIKQNIIM